MIRHMLLGLGAASLLVVVTAMPVQAAGELLGTEPPTSVIFTTGVLVDVGRLDWVWASPCAGVQQSCGLMYEPLLHGFAFPTELQWTESFASRDALERAFTVTNLAGVVTGTICAANYFTLDGKNNHCDLGDLRGGYIWRAPFPLAPDADHRNNGLSDSWLVRRNSSVLAPPVVTPIVTPINDNSGTSVPEPSSLLLLGAGLLGLAAWRWKHAA